MQITTDVQQITKCDETIARCNGLMSSPARKRMRPILQLWDKTINTFDSCFGCFIGKKHISIRGTNNLMVYSNQPLPAFADEDEVDASAGYEIPDLFPISPTIDLRKQHVWRPENITGNSSLVRDFISCFVIFCHLPSVSCQKHFVFGLYMHLYCVRPCMVIYRVVQ